MYTLTVAKENTWGSHKKTAAEERLTHTTMKLGVIEKSKRVRTRAAVDAALMDAAHTGIGERESERERERERESANERGTATKRGREE